MGVVMDIHDLMINLRESGEGKIVLLVSDGIGGLPLKPGGLTELETAKTPNLDALAKIGVQGLSIPIKPGITPGSGPGHLGLFGYDPLKYIIGRGALEAAGIGFAMTENDVAIRGNFCTIDAAGNISDRRASRIPSDESAKVVAKLRDIKISGVELFVEPVKEHRFVLVIRGAGLGDAVADTDPQRTGVPPLDPVWHNDNSKKTAEIAKEFFNQAKKILANEPKANCLTLRGFAKKPHMPSYQEIYGLKAACIAVYPMYKGLASFAGMELVGKPATLSEEIDTLENAWKDYDFFFVHFKYTDSRGEDGNFDEKVKMIEELDKVVPRISALKPACLIVTGDHSTPAKMASHSFHPVPTLIVSDLARTDATEHYGERDAVYGGLGHFEAMYLMPLAMAHAGRLGKFGA
ncbi:MAG: 2,3-bisphosphoglycerate-independent phosphoglycerate mutase [Planctomycetaceae bacterium]|jgi:2,3-bisphosphoglycerate-independent phosphoglycerate mutase|nr:2,3-bisphosphoglycerate-independent phosphoglycerate mutase [Planctomycetaceae bacterium]